MTDSDVTARMGRLAGHVRANGLWLTALLSGVVLVGAVLLADPARMLDAAAAVGPWRLGAALALVSVGYAVRFLKWDYYRRVVEIEVPVRTSLLTFTSGLMMTVTPGKVGEVWKAWFLKRHRGVAVSRTVPVVVAERVTDLTALLGLAALGPVVFGRSWLPLAGVAVFLVGIPALLQWRSGCRRLLRGGAALPVVGERIEQLEPLYENSAVLFRPVPTAVGTATSLVAWGLEGVGLWVLLDAGRDADLLVALFVFGAGSVLGAVSLLPGGLVAVEAGMVGLLVTFEYTRTVAVTATLLFRAATLWYGAALGLGVYAAFRLRRR